MAQVRMIDSLPAISAQEASACIDCGLCSYVCPSRLALAVTIHSLKTAKARTGTPGETT
jgi:Na+-translocating ferredoxin:NAD+ oxidoreductase RnfC subunit